MVIIIMENNKVGKGEREFHHVRGIVFQCTENEIDALISHLSNEPKE